MVLPWFRSQPSFGIALVTTEVQGLCVKEEGEAGLLENRIWRRSFH
jgi:hypothetical protein